MQTTSGIYRHWSSMKPKIFVLCANKQSFDTWLALGVDKEERDKSDFIFIEKADDISDNEKETGYEIKIIDDFCLNPNIVEILKEINKQTIYCYNNNFPIIDNLGNIGGTSTKPSSNLFVTSNSTSTIPPYSNPP